MSDLRPLLVIAYKYPPYPGVGGLRWAKLSKYLARLGHEVHVVTVPWAGIGAAPGTAPPGVTVHEIRSGSAHRLRHRPLRGRLPSAARAETMGLVDRRLFYDDEAQRWGIHLLPACEHLIQTHGLTTVIATGHPFQANRWAAALKRRNPELTLIQDFRDPWAANPFRTLPPKRAADVRGWQHEAVVAANAIVSVTPRLLELYTAAAPDTRAQVVHNGVDPEDLPPSGGSPPPPDEGPIRLTHIGNVSNGRDRPLAELLDAIRELPAEAPRFEVSLIGSQAEPVARAHPDLIRAGVLRTHPAVSRREAFERVAASDYALQLNAREFPYGLSTKIYEYALLRVPVISLNYGGDIDELVTTHGFGHSLDLSTGPDLRRFLETLPRRPETELAFDVEPFTHPVLARRYSELIESL